LAAAGNLLKVGIFIVITKMSYLPFRGRVLVHVRIA
jgi:hypothetical protein